MTVRDFYSLIDSIAPFSSQAGFDNSGILVGSPGAEIKTVLFALDITPSVLKEASELNAGLIVTHHPLMLEARRNITDDDFEGSLISEMLRMNISHIAAHTNLDIAYGGTNDILARICGLKSITGDNFTRTGELPYDMTAAEFTAYLGNALSTTVRLFGSPSHRCRKICVCSGSGSGEWHQSLKDGADTFVTGEIRHHHALEMLASGIAAFECGHYATEHPGIMALADTLQTMLHDVKSDLRIFKSCSENCGF